jgi:hypothetical protein
MKRRTAFLTFAVSALLLATTAYAARIYYAQCGHEVHGLEWKGTERASMNAAQDDCTAHIKRWPGHRCGVQILDK